MNNDYNHLDEKTVEDAVDVSYKEVPTYYEETIKKEQPKKRGMKKFVIGTLIASLIGGTAIGTSFAFLAPYGQALYNENQSTSEAQDATKENELNQEYFSNAHVKPLAAESNIADIAESVGPSVVSIKNNKTVMTWAGEFNESGLGSGVIFHEDAEKIYMITNAHVVEDATNLVITFLGNTKVNGQIVGSDPITDIAVISALKSDIPQETLDEIKPAVLGDSNNLRVGELAVAIGNPIDEVYNNTVTVGVISALDREIQLTDRTMKLIQTDAAINPGNSGGALVGPSGEVIGINTIKLVDSQIEGMGFAIPINDVKPIVQELMDNGRIARPSLGIKGYDMTEELGIYELPVGVLVVEVVPGSSAEMGGLQPKDIILEFDNQKISTMEELKKILLQKQIGDEVPVKIVRGNQKINLTVKLQEMPTAMPQG